MLCPAKLPKLDHANQDDLIYAAAFFRHLDEMMVRQGLVKTKANLDGSLIPAALCAASQGVLGTACNVIREALRIALRRGGAGITAQDISDAIDAWAIPQGFVQSNPLLV